MESATETRWLVLGTDGRHVTLGRHSDPDADELARVEGLLRAKNLSGWLVLMKGAYYVRQKPELMMVRPLGGPSEGWDTAVASFEANWRAAIGTTKSMRKVPGG